MTTSETVSKLWNLCNVLRDDGITYHQYVTECRTDDGVCSPGSRSRTRATALTWG